MRLLLHLLFPALLCGCFSLGATHGNEAEPARSAEGRIIVQKGIRFVFKDIPEGGKDFLYMPVNKKEAAAVPIMAGLVGERVPFPQGGVIEFYDRPIEKGKTEGAKKLLSSPLPGKLSDQMIGVVIPHEEGWGIFYLDEKELKAGVVLMKNLTNQPVQIGMGEGKYFVLKPGEEHTFAPGWKEGGKGNTYSGKLFSKNEKEQWYVSRQFAVQVRKLDAELCLFTWNKRIQRQDVQKITIAPEYVMKKKPLPAKPARLKRPYNPNA